MSRRTLRASICMIASMLASACGGGGSGGGVNSTPAPPSPPAFTSFGAIQPATTAIISGMTREGTGTGVASGSDFLLPPAGISDAVEGSGSLSLSVDTASKVTGVTIAGASSSVNFVSPALGQKIYLDGAPVALVASNSSRSDQAIIANFNELGFNYQTFGIWVSGLVSGSTGKYGVISAGSKTVTSALPSSGRATFRGYAGALLAGPDGTTFRYGANASFITDFSARTVSMSTSGGGLTRSADDAFYPLTSSLTGVMSYSPGSTAFNGTLSIGDTPAERLSGPASGTFYGPNAQELGGTFSLRGPIGVMVGGFGAKQ